LRPQPTPRTDPHARSQPVTEGPRHVLSLPRTTRSFTSRRRWRPVVGAAWPMALAPPGPHLQSSLNPGGLAMTSNMGSSWAVRQAGPASPGFRRTTSFTWIANNRAHLLLRAQSPTPSPKSGDVAPQDQLAGGYAQPDGQPRRRGRRGRTPPWSVSWSREKPSLSPPAPPPGRTGLARQLSRRGLLVRQQRAFSPRPIGPVTDLLDGGPEPGNQVSTLFSQPVPQHKRMWQQRGKNFNSGDGNYPEAGPGGSLYVLVSCGYQTPSWPRAPTKAVLGRSSRPRPVRRFRSHRLTSSGWTSRATSIRCGSTAPTCCSSGSPVTGGLSWSAPPQQSPHRA